MTIEESDDEVNSNRKTNNRGARLNGTLSIEEKLVRYLDGPKKGQPVGCEQNLRIVLSGNGILLAYNQFLKNSEILYENEWRLLDDDIHDRIYLMLPRDYGFKIAAADCFKMLETMAKENFYHPILDWLDGLQWDGVHRLYGWLHTYGGASDDQYTGEVGELMLVAAVRRIREPGCKFDHMLVLEGPEGCGKSSAIRILSQGYFTDSILIHSPDPRHALEALHGVWLAEYAELAGLRKAEVEIVKSFLSRQSDRARPAYGRKTIEQWRQWIIFGSTNEEEYLASKTGNRRFWPVKVKQFNLAKLAADCMQLWAEAVIREKEWDALMLSSVVAEQAIEEQQKREISDAWEDKIREWIKTGIIPSSDGERCTTLLEVAVGALGIMSTHLDRQSQLRIAENLRKVGFERKKSNSKIRWTLKKGAQGAE